ncbi:MAG: TldD/PmbA family protein [bacterium]|nr:TldD/PmbA family protein [bacterium]
MDEQLVRETLDEAAQLGAADAEIVFTTSVDLEVEVADGEVETLAVSESIGAGVRLLTSDRRMGFAYATDLAGGASALVSQAWDNAQVNEPDPHNVLLELADQSDDDWTEQDFAQIPVPDKVAFAKELEQRVKEADSRIEQVRFAKYQDSLYDFTIANSRGLQRRLRNAYCTASALARAAADGVDPEMGWEFDFARTFDGLRLDWLAESCALDATRRLGGKPCATGSMPVVLDNAVTVDILGVLASALMANNVLKGKSFYAEHIGDSVAADCITLIDQNDYAGGMNRAPFDGEGASAQTTRSIEGGVLKQFLHNAYTADKMGEGSTANAGRGGFRSTPEVSATNLYLLPGEMAQEDLIKAAGDGLFVTEAMGVHTADPISGDFSFGASGLAVEGGELARPVRGVTIAGNVKDLMTNIGEVGSDLRFFGACGAPSVLLSHVMVSGE